MLSIIKRFYWHLEPAKVIDYLQLTKSGSEKELTRNETPLITSVIE